MARRHHYKRRTKDGYEIDVTTFLNLMVVLVPFLLITAVFSRLTIVELDLPSSAGGPASPDDSFRLEVIVRAEGIEIGNGIQVIASLPKEDGEYDLETLANYVMELKREYPEQEAASVLMEPFIPYDYLIVVMDIVRSAEVLVEGSDTLYEHVALFTDISVGDAPVRDLAPVELQTRDLE